MKALVSTFILIVFSFFLTACKQPDINTLSLAAGSIMDKVTAQISTQSQEANDVVLGIGEVIDKSPANVNMSGNFIDIVRDAVENDPLVLSARANYLARTASVKVTKSLKDFQFSGTIYGGIEDVSDETAGIAAALNANKLIYDGGLLDSRISADEYYALGAFEEYQLVRDERALVALEAWVELDRYKLLSDLIGARLEVLDPLISQLERVAEAGLGDAAMVSAAQRTVSMIEVTQTDVEQRYAQAQIAFINVFGSLPSSVSFGRAAVSNALPDNISKDLITNSPALRAEYAKYQAALSVLSATRASDSVNLGFQTKIQRPFGESEYDSDESVGLVLTKTLYNGGKLNSEIEAAEAQVSAQLESFKATYRMGDRAVQAAQESITSMEKAIDLAKSNAKNTRDEINYLRQQLVIGQSTLESVLSGEARLYDAEAKEINFISDRYLAELTILSATGLMSGLLGID